MKVLLIDNFDSFTYNLAHYIEAEGVEVQVVRNTQLNEFVIHDFDRIVFSPGPGLPYQSQGMIDVIEQFYRNKPMLGVCLGMQALAEFFGGSLYNMKVVKHGVSEPTNQIGKSKLFDEIPQSFEVGLYHSWAVSEPLPDCLIPTLRSKSGVLMGLEHKSLPIYAVQFHPESILTPHGKIIIQNFLKLG